MNGRYPSTPYKALQTLYDLAVENTMAHDPDRLKGRDPETAEAVERVRVHFGLKAFPR